MSEATVFFHSCIQDSQEYGSDDEHMVSRLFFRLTVDGRDCGEMFADVKQPVGGAFESTPLEVSKPQGGPYHGPFNYAAFRDAAEAYYRTLVGQSASMIRLGPGVSGVRMRNNRFAVPSTTTFSVSGRDISW